MPTHSHHPLHGKFSFLTTKRNIYVPFVPTGPKPMEIWWTNITTCGFTLSDGCKASIVASDLAKLFCHMNSPNKLDKRHNYSAAFHLAANDVSYETVAKWYEERNDRVGDYGQHAVVGAMSLFLLLVNGVRIPHGPRFICFNHTPYCGKIAGNEVFFTVTSEGDFRNPCYVIETHQASSAIPKGAGVIAMLIE